MVGGVSVHVTELAAALARRKHEVHVFTRQGHQQPHYELIHGVHYHRCPFTLHPNFVDEVNNMCRSFVHHFNAAEGRGRKAVLTMHSTEYGRNGNRFHNGQSQRVSDHERHGTFCADRVITVSNLLREEIKWLYQLPDHKTKTVYNGVNAETFDYPFDAGEVKRRYAIGPLDP